MKESSYNVWVGHGAARYVYNGVSGGLLRVSTAEYESLQGFLAGDPTSGSTGAPEI